MKTSTLLLIGAGVVAGGTGIVLWTRSAKAKTKAKTKAKAGHGEGEPKGSKGPKRTRSPKKPPKSAPAEGGVYRFSAAEAKTVVCNLRGAKNIDDVRAVLDSLNSKIDASGASEVDLRSSGLTEGTVPVEQFKNEAGEIVRRMRLLPQFMWEQARSRMDTALSNLPDCDAPMQQWKAMFGEASGVQAAVRPPPFTLLQGLRPLQG